MTGPRYVGVTQAAKRLGCHPETIRRLIAAKKLLAFRLPGNRRAGNYQIPAAALDHLERQRISHISPYPRS